MELNTLVRGAAMGVEVLVETSAVVGDFGDGDLNHSDFTVSLTVLLGGTAGLYVEGV